MNSKKALISLMLITTLVAQNKGARPKGMAEPKPIIPFQLSYEDIPMIEKLDLRGSILVHFTIDKYGKVVKPEIVNSFTNLVDNLVGRSLSFSSFKNLSGDMSSKIQILLP